MKKSKQKKINKKILNFNAVFSEENDGGFFVSVPSLPGCFSEGDNFEKAVKNIKEAVNLYLQDENESILDGVKTLKKEFLVPIEIYG